MLEDQSSQGVGHLGSRRFLVCTLRGLYKDYHRDPLPFREGFRVREP